VGTDLSGLKKDRETQPHNSLWRARKLDDGVLGYANGDVTDHPRNQFFVRSRVVMINITEESIQRFHSRYVVDPITECWVWQRDGEKCKNLYGTFRINRKIVRAHRFSWELHFGIIPDGVFVCHHCDNPPCCNPSHLFLGTAKENNDDCHRKGRAPLGELHRKSKLTNELIRMIRSDSRPYPKIAKTFGISPANVCLIKQRKAWRNVS
jgi:hypothetical protein